MEIDEARQRITARLGRMYADGAVVDAIWSRLEPLLGAPGAEPAKVPEGLGLDETDALLITYGDQFTKPGEPPLRTLKAFMDEYLTGYCSGLHLLPHYPWSSDDGFSVIDYRKVDPALGSWDDVDALAQTNHLMFDAVINHVSSEGPWFAAYLRGEAPYDDYFHVLPEDTDVASVYRPRAHPLLSAFETSRGVEHVWTTFSRDQVDLDFSNPNVLVEMLEILIGYARHGANLLRLDAIGLLWKKLGTSCLHLPETHEFVKLVRDVMDVAAPQVLLVPEINGPYEENAPYFGDGHDEAQLVYNFTLPPMTLDAIYTGDASLLASWLETVSFPSERTTFFNFLASHDGIGVRPAEPLLPADRFQALIERTLAHGGRVNYRTGPDGEPRPYELTITYYDALTRPDESLQVGVARFRAAHAILLSLAGLPGIYAHSLFGTASWHEGLAKTKHNRTLNRQKLELEAIAAELSDESSRAAQVYGTMTHMLGVRRTQPAFHPTSRQRVIDLDPRVLGVERGEGTTRVRCLVNVSSETVTVNLAEAGTHPWEELLTKQGLPPRDGTLEVSLEPYGVRWLRATG